MKPFLKELKHHIPFTASATIIAIIFVFIIKSSNTTQAFEILHPLHIIASAIVTSAIYFKYKKNIPLALLIGLTGSIIIGSISDVILPYLGALLFNFQPSFHLPLIEEPIMILSSALIGTIFGIATKITRFPHFVHVSLSVFASLLYITSFSQNISSIYWLASFIIVFIAVLVPCCISDIIYPLMFVGKNLNKKKKK